MRKYAAVLIIVLIAAVNTSPVLFGTDYINDDYQETNINAFHSFGFLDYGFHSNTFNVRYLFLRYNLTVEDLQFFTTVNGYKDTHNPETNYNDYILNNINLYDYGITYTLFKYGFISLRGAASYQMNYDTILLFAPYNLLDDPAQYDAPLQYIPNFVNAAGIRAGIRTDSFELGYSQGDFRHLIPSSIIARYSSDIFYVKGIVQYEHADPSSFDPTDYNIFCQISSGANYKAGEFKLQGMAEVTEFYTNNSYRSWLRLEEGVEYQGYTFGIRELLMSYAPTIYEFAIKKNLYDLVSIGFQYATDGRFYFGTLIDF